MAYVKDTGKISDANVDTSPGSFGSLPSAGNFIGVLISTWSSGGQDIPAPTDNQSNTYTRSNISTNSNSARSSIAYAENIGTPSGTFTITVDPVSTGAYLEWIAVEFSDIDTTSPQDVISDSTGSSAAVSTGVTGTTSQGDELVLAVCCVSINSTDVNLSTPAATGYTNLALNQDANATIGMSADYKIVSATGTQEATWTCDSGAWGACIATFTISASAPTGNGDLENAAAAVDGEGTSQSAGDASLSSVASTVEGSGNVVAEAKVGNGSLVSGNISLAGEGTSQSLGDATLAAAASSLSGSASIANDSRLGSGDLAADAAEIAAEGTSQSAGNGDLAAGASSLSGRGHQEVIVSLGAATTTEVGSGSITPAAMTISPSPGITEEGGPEPTISTATGADGDLAAAASDISGEGTSQSAGNGDLAAQSAVVDGDAFITSNAQLGQGTLAVASASVSGSGDNIVRGEGTLSAAASEVSSLGDSGIHGSGTLAAAASEIDASSALQWLTTGTLAAGTANVAGSGVSKSLGNGSLDVSLARIAATADTGVTLQVGKRKFAYRRRQSLRVNTRAA